MSGQISGAKTAKKKSYPKGFGWLEKKILPFLGKLKGNSLPFSSFFYPLF